MTTTTLPLETVLKGWADGDGRGWHVEFMWLEREHGAELDALTTSVRACGILEPIVLGSDGRVWDGHHRLYAATVLSLPTVPVAFDGSSPSSLSSAPWRRVGGLWDRMPWRCWEQGHGWLRCLLAERSRR